MAKSGGIKREYVRERDRESDNCTEEEGGGRVYNDVKLSLRV